MSKTDLIPPLAGSATRAARRGFRIPEEIGVIIALVGMMAIIGFARPRFLNPINLFSLLGNTTFLGMLAIGMVFLLAIREIDLSVGWMFNFSAVFAALLMVAGIDPWLSAFAGVLFGAGLGLINGLIAVTLRLPAIIVTLGTYSMFQGLSLVVNKGRAIVPAGPEQQLLLGDLRQAVWHRAGGGTGFHRTGARHACRASPHPLRLPRASRRQQPRSRRPCRHSNRQGAACRRWC